RLSLHDALPIFTLTIGDEGAQTFDSGLVSGGGSFPEIDIAMSMNGMSCFDTVIDIRSKPVSTPYALSASTYDEGCFAPCLCAIREWPVAGSAELVPLPNAATPIREEFAVVDVVWATISTSPPPDRQFTGFGTYQIVRKDSTSQHRMVLDLTEASSGRCASRGRRAGSRSSPARAAPRRRRPGSGSSR